jgi:ABC-type lipoprotein release transport system permease subunit
MRGLFNIVMRIISSLVGLLMLASGSVWTMQGLGVGPEAIMRGFMVGDWHWTLYGALMALAGLGQVVWSNMRQKLS